MTAAGPHAAAPPAPPAGIAPGEGAIRLILPREEDLLVTARALGAALEPGDLVLLYGPLGAGKTTFCKGVAEALGISPERVTSPTFTLVAVHEGGRVPLVHADAWRIPSPGAAEDGGLDEALARGDAVTLLEWPENVEILLPTPLAKVRFDFLTGEGEGRELRIELSDPSRLARFLSRVRRFHTGG